MRLKKRTSNRITPRQRSFIGKQQQSQWSFGKIMLTIFVIWIVVMVVWVMQIAIGHDHEEHYAPQNSQVISQKQKTAMDNGVNHGEQISKNGLLSNQIPKQMMHLWKPQKLRKLDFQQPSYIVEMIKSEYDRAQWKPSNYKKTYDINYDILPQQYLKKIGHSKT